MIDTWAYQNDRRIWYQLLFTLRHPIHFVKTFKEEMYAWPSLPNTLRKSWLWLYTRLPLQKACRWLGHELIYRVYDNKILDTFECRTRGKTTKYYFATCHFGFYKFYEKVFLRDGKTCNIFFDFTVGGLVDGENAKKKAAKTRTEQHVIAKGWVFTKKAANRRLRQIIEENREIFGKCYEHPEADEPYFVEYANEMVKIVKGSKIKEYQHNIYDTYMRKLYESANDPFVRLYCYVADLMHCRNDFGAHFELAEILSTCDGVIYHKEFVADPYVDQNYERLMKEGKDTLAKQYRKEQIAFHDIMDKSAKKEVLKRIQTFKDKLVNKPLDYYRC